MMRWSKHGRSHNVNRGAGDLAMDPAFRCCGCCHVQTGTICLGVYNLVGQIIALSVLTFAILHPDVLYERVSGRGDMEMMSFPVDNGKLPAVEGKEENLPALPTPLSLSNVEPDGKGNFQFSKADMMMFTKKRLESGDAHMALALMFGLAMITMLMIFGAIKGRPLYLLPFFCVQVFDFIISCLTAVGHYSWLPAVHDLLVSNPGLPFREEVMKMNSQWVALIVLLLYVMALMVKAYFIGVIWACYQYLHLRSVSIVTYHLEHDGEMLLPPDYETATKLQAVETVPPPMYATPPPEYQ